MKKFVKLISVLVIVVMATGFIFTGCGSNDKANDTQATTQAGKETTKVAASDKPDTSKAVALKMVLLGDEPADAMLVYDEVNKMAKKDINATVSLEFFPWSSWKDKYQLMFASGAEVDIIYSANWADYTTHSNKGAFMEVTEAMLKKAAPQTAAKMPKDAWEQSKVGGKIYMIPQSVLEYPSFVMAIRGDLRKKYNLPEVKNLNDLEKYLYEVAKNEKDIIPLASNGGLRGEFTSKPGVVDAYYETISNTYIGFKNWKKDDMKAEFFLQTEESKNYFKRMKKWYGDKIFSASALTQKESDEQLFELGKSACADWTLDQISSMAARLKLSKPEWQVEIVDIIPDVPKAPSVYIQNGLCLDADTKNADRALMFIDLLKWNKDYTDLTWYGIKGTHYEEVGEDKFKSLDAAKKFPSGSVCPWGWRGPLERWDVNRPDTSRIILNTWKEKYKDYPYAQNFKFDDSNVKAEVAALTNIGKTYIIPLRAGVLDYDQNIEKIAAEMKKAGLDKVMQELQKQIDAYKKAN